MKVNDEMDNNNNTDSQKVAGKRGRSRKIVHPDTKLHKKSDNLVDTNVDTAALVNSSEETIDNASPRNTSSPANQRKTPASGKRRDLINLQSTLNIKYIGLGGSPNLMDAEEDRVRVTRNRKSLFHNSGTDVKDEISAAADLNIGRAINSVSADINDAVDFAAVTTTASATENKSAEAVGDDAAGAVIEEIQVKRKKKRGRRSKKILEMETTEEIVSKNLSDVGKEIILASKSAKENVNEENVVLAKESPIKSEQLFIATELENHLKEQPTEETQENKSDCESDSDLIKNVNAAPEVESNTAKINSDSIILPSATDENEPVYSSDALQKSEKTSISKSPTNETNVSKHDTNKTEEDKITVNIVSNSSKVDLAGISTVANLNINAADSAEINKESTDQNEQPNRNSVDNFKIPHQNSDEKHHEHHSPALMKQSSKLDTENLLNSPSSVSLDSAKGSSIVTDTGSLYQPGDLFWGRLYAYCFWPCMVCPDPYNQSVGVTAAQNSKSTEHANTIQVHVRFFADNGRRNWIKQENLLPYAGFKAFEALRDDIRIKFGVKSAKFRNMVPKRNQLTTWNAAISEANLVAEVPYPDRIAKFFEIYDNSVSFQKQKRKRRSSMIRTANSTSDIGSSIYGSTEKLYTKQMLLNPKRERSESPFSPAYSPVKGTSFIPKRRKVSHDNVQDFDEDDLNMDFDEELQFIMHQGNSALYLSKEFLQLYKALKEFVIDHDRDENMERLLLSISNNVWSLSVLHNRSRNAQEAKDKPADTPSDQIVGSVKRLSKRLRNISKRRSQSPMIAQQPLTQTNLIKMPERRASDVVKQKKILNRPIDEVVDDILNLDKKYLFRGLARDPVCKYCNQPGGDLKRCTKGCNTWLHDKCPNTGVNVKKRNSAPKEIVSEQIKLENVESTEIESIQSSPTITPTPTPSLLDEPQQKTLVLPSIHITAESDSTEGEISDVAKNEEPRICKECETNAPDICCICHLEKPKLISPPTSPLKSSLKNPNESDQLVTCNMPNCNQKFHPSCCKYWPQAKISKSTVRCPTHVCHTCVSDDPRGKFQQLGNAKLTKCVKCPASFHMDSHCIPAGSQILTAAHIICPRHSTTKADMNINVTWCYICVQGGELICCETCPIAVHAHCRKIPIKPNEVYICEECESGRLPLYGEIVWAKFNNFRWWPAIIMPPTEVPNNIARKAHMPSDFVVRFFGTHDHGWISRRRVYLYIEGDAGEQSKSKSQLDQNYMNGVAEASRFLRILKERRMEQAIAMRGNSKLHPQPYVKIKTNKPVPPVKFHIDLQNVNKCECNPDAENPCGPDSECLNRVLFNECNPKICNAGQRCENQMLETRISPRLEVVYMNQRGFGLVCREPIKEGSFIIEYVGEVINDAEFRLRMAQKTRDRDENFYFLVVEKDYIIDAGPKGNLARFMNHSCEPNCETQKWVVNGINRVGLFAIMDIPENTELTFNYHWDNLMDNQKKVCICGAPKCAGEIGGKYKEDTPKDIVEPTTKNNLKSKKKFKELKRLQKKKQTKIKIDFIDKKLKKKEKTPKHVSADDVIGSEL